MTPDAVVAGEPFVRHPPHEVWRVLTDPDLLPRRWAPGDIRPVVGHRLTLGLQACEVVVVEPERLLSYTFAAGALDTRIAWRLVPAGTGIRLDREPAGFDVDCPLGCQAHEGMGNGWLRVLAGLDSTLAGARVGRSG